MNYSIGIRIVGVVLSGFIFVHYQGMPWGLLSAASVACLFLP